MFSWISGEDALSNAALTAKAQVIDPRDVGRLLWPDLFPRVNAPSIKINEISTLDFRPVADRREWNQRGRLIPLRTPGTKEFEMVPVESNFRMAEYEIQRINERVEGNEALFRRIVGADVLSQINSLAGANFRRIELDAFLAWATGTIVARDPQGGAANKTVNLGFAAGRYVTPAAWTGGDSGTAYAQFMIHLEAALELMGSVAGAMMRLATYRAIQESAPRPAAAPDVRLTANQLRELIEDDTGRPFRFFINEESHDVFNDGGTATTRTKAWTANRVGFMPEGFRIGSTHFAPVARAWDIARAAPQVTGLDVRGNTVFTDVGNGGREFTTECQVNALPIPDEQNVYVVNAGI